MFRGEFPLFSRELDRAKQDTFRKSQLFLIPKMKLAGIKTTLFDKQVTFRTQRKSFDIKLIWPLFFLNINASTRN